MTFCHSKNNSILVCILCTKLSRYHLGLSAYTRGGEANTAEERLELKYFSLVSLKLFYTQSQHQGKLYLKHFICTTIEVIFAGSASQTNFSASRIKPELYPQIPNYETPQRKEPGILCGITQNNSRMVVTEERRIHLRQMLFPNHLLSHDRYIIHPTEV